MTAEHAEAFRIILVTVGIVLFLVLAGMYLAGYRKMVMSERLFGFAVLMIMLYLGDAMREAIQIGLGYRSRLIALVLGEAAFIAWLLEPAAARRERLKNSWIRRRNNRGT